MAVEKGYISKENIFYKGQKIFVEVDECINGILIVMMQYGPKLYKGVLFDSSNRLNTLGVNKDRLVPQVSTESSDLKIVQTPSTCERYTYKLDGQTTVTVLPQPVLRRERKSTHFARILRPRQFLCRKCKNTFDLEPEDKELCGEPSGESDSCRSGKDHEVRFDDVPILSSAGITSRIGTAGGTLKSEPKHRRCLLKPRRYWEATADSFTEESIPQQQQIHRVTLPIIPRCSNDMPEGDLMVQDSSSSSSSSTELMLHNKQTDLQSQSGRVDVCDLSASVVATGSAMAAAVVPVFFESVLNDVLNSSKRSSFSLNCSSAIYKSEGDVLVAEPIADPTESIYDFQEEELSDDRILRRKPKRQAHEKLKDRWMREETIRRQQEERKAAFERQLHHPERQRRKRKRRNTEATQENVVGMAVAADEARLSSPPILPMTPTMYTVKPLQSSTPSVPTQASLTVSTLEECKNSADNLKTCLSSPVVPAAPPDASPVSIKIKINRVSQANGSYQVQLVDSSSCGLEASSPVALNDNVVAAATRLVSKKARNHSISKKEGSHRGTISSLTTSSLHVVSENESNSLRRCILLDGRRFQVGDVVWAKIAGYPWWPSFVLNLQSVTTKEKFIACVEWYNWGQVSYIPVDKLYPFLEHFKTLFNKRKKGAYKTAVDEAWAAAHSVRAAESEAASADGTAVMATDAAAVENGDEACTPQKMDGAATAEAKKQVAPPPEDFDSMQQQVGCLLPDLGANLGRELGQIGAVDIPTFSDEEEEYERCLIIDTEADRIIDRIDS